MLIDWFTVGAQVLNFAILVWLMKRFLYIPVQEAIATREGRIADTLATAQRKLAEAKQDRDDFQHRNEKFDSERASLLAQAAAHAGAEHERLMADARQAAEALTDQRRKSLADEAQNLGRALRSRTQKAVFAVARKTLADLAGTGLEARACEVFTQRLRAIGDVDRETMAAALKASNHGALVRSAFDLLEPQRAAVQRAVDDTFSIAATLQFDTAPDLVAGIELSAQGYKFAWSISDYLATLDASVSALLESPAVATSVAA